MMNIKFPAILICFLVKAIYSYRNYQTFVPINFRDGIIQAGEFKDIVENQNNRSIHLYGGKYSYVRDYDYLIDQFFLLKNSISQFMSHEINHVKFLRELNISTECLAQVGHVLDGIKKGKEFAIKFFDAYGKPPSGILNGNMAWLGEFGECRNITSMKGNFTGKYCMISTPIDATSFFRPNLTLSLKYGICVPNKCSQQDIYEIINYLIESIPTNVTHALPFSFNISIDYIQIQEMKSLDQAACIVLGIIGSIVFIVLLGTLVDIYKRYRFHLKCMEILSNSTLSVDSSTVNSSENNNNNELNNSSNYDSNRENVYLLSIGQEKLFVQILIGFSAYTNSKKLFKVNLNGEQLKCLDAIRFLSIAWVILGHCYIIVIGFSDNPYAVVSFIQRFSFLIVSNAFFSVDSFFLMSGLLTSYVFLRQAEKKNNRITVLMMLKYYVHRYWRVLPPYLVAMTVSIYLSGYFGIGPLYPTNGYEPEFCRTSWWRNALFINNLDDADKWCFGVSWYLANDMQFHILAPLILVPLAIGKRLLSGIITVLILVGNIIAIALTLYFNEGTEMAQFGAKTFHDFFLKFYILPWCRIGPYLVGLALGYAIFLYKKKTVIKINKYLNVFLWILSIFLCALLIFGLYPDVRGQDPLDRETHIFYQSFSKLTWSLCISFMIYSCISSTGGFINDILSSPVWVPLSRLTYGAFLTHVMVMVYFNATQEHLIHLQDVTLIYYFVSNLAFSFVASYLFSIFFEIPLIGLEKFIFKH